MAATSAQIEAVLSLTGDYSLITGAATITDNSAWGSIGVATPDTVKILLWIEDSAGNEFYKNAGWDAGVYTAPDLSLLDTEYDFTLPTDIAGDYLQGQYTIYAKCQVVEGSDTTVVQKTFYQNVSAQCNDITLTTEAGVVAGTTEVKITDTTNYATYTDLSRTMILYPPPPSGQASQTGTDVDVIVYSGTVYTGVWTWKLTSDVTFTDAITGSSTTCRLTAQGTFNVEQSQLCKVLCLIEKYRNQTLLPTLTRKNGNALLQTYFLAMTEFQLARDGYICGKSSTVIDAHIQKVYDLLGIDPDCDCGCDDGTSQPLLSVTTVDGTDGTNGSVIYSGSGAPSGGTGVVGDYFVRSDTGGWYKKTGATTWTLQFTIVGATGAAGADGVTVLYNNFSDTATPGNSTWNTLDTFDIPANQFANDGDVVRIKTSYINNTATGSWTPGQSVRVTVDGNSFTYFFPGTEILFQTSTTYIIQLEIFITRTDTDTVSYYVEYTILLGGASSDTIFSASSGYTRSNIRTQASLDFTQAITVNADAYSVSTGDLTNEFLFADYEHQA